MRILIATLLALSLIGGPTTTFAKNSERSGVSRRAKKRQARRLAKKSEASYRAGQLEESADYLRRAYDLDPAPILLFNLARVLDDAGRLDEALDTYTLYLERARKPRDRPRIEARIATIERMLQVQEEARAAAPEPIESPPLATASPIEEEPSPPTLTAPPPETPSALPTLEVTSAPRETSVAPWVLVGGGSVAVATGTVLAILAQGKKNEAIDARTQIAAVDARDSANLFGTLGTATLVVGGALATSGLVWMLWSDDDNDQTMVMTPYADAGAAVRLQF